MILEIPVSSPLPEIKQAYRDLAQIWHPDRHAQNERLQAKALEKMKELNAAYDCIIHHFNGAKTSGHAYDEAKQKSSRDPIVVCPQCGTKNRFDHPIDGAIAKCGRCGGELFVKKHERQNGWNYRTLCGDGACIGILKPDGRCNVCGKTYSEGKASEGLRKQSHVYKKPEPSPSKFKKWLGRGYPLFAVMRKHPFWCLVGVSILYSLISNEGTRPHQSTTVVPPSHKIATPKPTYIRPSSAPNGQSWPANSGYVRNYPLKYTNGLSNVTIDNAQNVSDIFIKLYCRDAKPAIPIRYFLIKGGGKFTAKKIRSGNYEIRYKNLDTWACSRSQSFYLKEIEIPDEGVKYSNIEMTLYKVPHGNMQTYAISDEEF